MKTRHPVEGLLGSEFPAIWLSHTMDCYYCHSARSWA